MKKYGPGFQFYSFFSYIYNGGRYWDTGTGLNDSEGFKVKDFEWTVVENSLDILRMEIDLGDIVLLFKNNSFSFQYIIRDSTRFSNLALFLLPCLGKIPNCR
jgi:hypothetical protein